MDDLPALSCFVEEEPLKTSDVKQGRVGIVATENELVALEVVDGGDGATARALLTDEDLAWLAESIRSLRAQRASFRPLEEVAREARVSRTRVLELVEKGLPTIHVGDAMRVHRLEALRRLARDDAPRAKLRK